MNLQALEKRGKRLNRMRSDRYTEKEPGKAKNKPAAAVQTSASRKGKKPMSRKKKIASGITIALLVLLVAGAATAYWYVNSKLDKIGRSGQKIDERNLSIVDVDGYANILLLGSDTRDLEDYEGSRTDAIIIASIKEETGEVYLTSIYRDTFLKLGDTETYDKITHAFAYGGPQMAMQTVNQALDLNIKKYVLFNFQTVSDAVDMVGGINLNIKDYEIEELNRVNRETIKVIKYADKSEVTASGKQMINGAQAVSYGRMRSGVGDDFKRTDRMRTVVKVLINKVKGEKLSTIDKMTNKILPEIETNLSNGDIFALAKYLLKMKIAGSDGFPYEVTGGLYHEVSYVFPQDLYADVKELHKKVFHQENYAPTAMCREISDHIE